MGLLRFLRPCVLSALALLTSVTAAHAAESDAPPRPTPDYDGRGPKPTTAGDVALWVPRLVLSPLYLTSEYLVRRPLGVLITTAEQKQWASALTDLFTFGPDHGVGFVPLVF